MQIKVGLKQNLGIQHRRKIKIKTTFILLDIPDTTDGLQIKNIYAGGNCSFAMCISTEVTTQIHPVQSLTVERFNKKI